MSLFLGKIHYWLFNKIVWFEGLEKDVIELAKSENLNIEAISTEIAQKYGEMVPDKPLEDIKFVFTGDIRNNVCYGLMYGAVKMGMHFVCLGPESLHIDPEVLAYCKEEAKKSGGSCGSGCGCH